MKLNVTWQKIKLIISLKKITFREKNSASNTSISNSLKVYMVLPVFIVYPGIDDKRVEYWKIPLKLLKLLIWPREHIIRKEEKMSPFLRMLRKDNRAEIY